LEQVVAILLATAATAAIVAVAKTTEGAWWWIAVGAFTLAVAIPGYMSLERGDPQLGRETRAQLRKRFGRWYYVLLPLMAVAMVFLPFALGIWYVVGMFVAFYRGLREGPREM
jgi:4-hydroxybenzoate polyprenyltransferase